MKTMYVAQTPDKNGVDWGYTEKRDQALPLSVYWRRRFDKDRERCGAVAGFSETV
jgi:hypothetical protein